MGRELLPTFAEGWFAQWRRSATELAALHAQELRQLTSDDALAASELLLAMVDPMRRDPQRDSYSGLVDQQRLFRHGQEK